MSIRKSRKDGNCEAENCPNPIEYFVNYDGETAELCGPHTSVVKNADDSGEKIKDVLKGKYQYCEIEKCKRPQLWTYNEKKVCTEHYGER